MSNKPKLNQGALNELHKNHEQIEKKKEIRKAEYETAYKNVLWIDDRDDNDAESDELKWMLNFCELSDCMQIEQVDLFRVAVDRIINNSSQYDLVIFDINLKNGFDEISEDEIQNIEKQFSKFHIKFTYNDANHMYAGYYLFKLLLAVGYPLDRMLIFSGHTTKENAEEELKDIIFDKRIYIPKEKGKLNIEDKFFVRGLHDYYRIRRLVYQACNYWINELNGRLKNKADIPFNKLYYFNERSLFPKSAISAERFIDMLEHIQLLFPISAPQNSERLYFKVMQTVVSFHEESAKIQLINEWNLKKYHSCARNFRNWSAHNLMVPVLSASKFAILFCITLRTYFSWLYDSDLDNELFDYEEKFNFKFDPKININEEKIESTLLSLWETVHQKIKSRYYSDLEEAIRELGKVDECGDMGKYLFVPLWCPNGLLLPAETQIGNFKKTSQVLIDINRSGIKSLCERTTSPNNNSSDKCFKRFCYAMIFCDEKNEGDICFL